MDLVWVCLLIILQNLYAQSFSRTADISPYGVHRGMVIDAGSGGSRLHIYTWEPRIFNSVPPGITIPTTDEKWTGRMEPGVSTFADNPDDAYLHLKPLLDYAKETLKDFKDEWANYPIYFKATGGMREVPLVKKEKIMETIRDYLSDPTVCPFYFRRDFARVISGEEEAIYAWAGVNFLKGTLLPSTYGVGVATPDQDTYGVLDLGGASTQIAYFVRSQDVSEGLFKLHIGSQKHWNVYTKSFLKFGHVSARQRHLQLLVTDDWYYNDCTRRNAYRSKELQEDCLATVEGGKHEEGIFLDDNVVVNSCFFSGYTESVQENPNISNYVREHIVRYPLNCGGDGRRRRLNGFQVVDLNKCATEQQERQQEKRENRQQKPRYSAQESVQSDEPIYQAKAPIIDPHTYSVRGPSKPVPNQIDKCMTLLRPLMEKEIGGFCEWVNDGQCSIGGSYQPPLPAGFHFKFVGTSSYKYAWKFLKMPEIGTLQQFYDKSKLLCAMTYTEIQDYANKNKFYDDTSTHFIEYLPYFCFMASYNLVLLMDGYGFSMSNSLQVVEVIDGNKVGWPLGAILYEINTLPWALNTTDLCTASSQLTESTSSIADIPVDHSGFLGISGSAWCCIGLLAALLGLAARYIASWEGLKQLYDKMPSQYKSNQGYTPIDEEEAVDGNN